MLSGPALIPDFISNLRSVPTYLNTGFLEVGYNKIGG